MIAAPYFTPEKERRREPMNKERIRRVLQTMQEMDLQQTLISSPASLFYLTGQWIFPGERMAVLYLNIHGDAKLIANKLFALEKNSELPLIEYDDTDDCIQILARSILPGKTGIDKDWPSRFTIRLMSERKDIFPVIGSPCVDQTRLYKDKEEIRLMRESSRKNDMALKKTIEALHPGMTELEAAERYIKESSFLGSSGPSFDPLVCFGAGCAQPHHTSDQSVLMPGDSVILDVGLKWKNYCSDMTRTVFIGKATDEQKRIYDLVRTANEAGRAAVRPGVPLKEIDHTARKVIEDAGYGQFFIHRTGHGIGLDVHEYPDVSSSSDAVAAPGMIFSIEPGIYLPGKFGVRVEDLVCVTEESCETLNNASRELTELLF